MLKPSGINYLKKISLIALALLITPQLSCGQNDQFTQKLTAQPFVSKLFGQSTKTISIQTSPGEHIAWLGFAQSADYKYFQIERVNQHIPKNIDPTTVIENLSVATNSPFDAKPGAIMINGPLSVTITYRPLQAIIDLTKPHQAYLLIAYDEPDAGIVRLELNGFTQGINVSKCTRDPNSMDQEVYKLVDQSIDLYICDQNGVPDSQITPGAPGEKTNLTAVPIAGEITFYMPDLETVCILGSDKPLAEGGKPTPTIPDFKLPIPKGISQATDNLGTLDVNIKRSAFAECSLDNEGNIVCDNNVELEVFGGGVPVTPLRLSNLEQFPQSTDCGDFGAITGSGLFGDDEIELIGWGEVTPNNNTEQFNIDGALVVAVIRLKK